MNNVFNIDWSKLIKVNLPFALRQPLMLQWLECLLAPLVTLHNVFIVFRNESLYKVRHNSQIAYLENVLNDAFDGTLRRIKIRNAVFRTPLYFYEPQENREVYFYEPNENKPVYFYNNEDFDGDGVDFFVFVPPNLRPNNAIEEQNFLIKMRGLIDYYKLYSKNYSIKWELINN